MAISAADVKALRERTGAGMMDCKHALVEAGGDLDKAVTILREKGVAAASKKSSRDAKEGVVHTYIHPGSRIATMVELNCETDFVARNDMFQSLARDIAMQVAATKPQAVGREQMPQGLLDEESEIYRNQAKNEGKPEHIIDRIVQGRIEKFYQENCLLEQPFIRDTDKTVKDLITDAVGTLGENIQIRRFIRYELGGE
ncbi:MAG TPA: translation elongation factor Ts [candidate division Zixibacteria bacterium]|jgi:elongation factor Ts|nr:translation elongation factor Ts [Candidatus Latescibacterota bacterium]HIG47521.1 translation elongation factor Ts [candidate division Zixibacteria bacterium]